MNEVGYSGFKRKNGLKRSVLVEGHGIPVSFSTTKANIHDLRSAIPTIDRLTIGKRRRRFKRIRADKGYDSVAFRSALRKRGARPAIDARNYSRRRLAKRRWNDTSEIRYARPRWKVEQRFACLDQNRRLGFLYERTRSAYETFMTIACVRCYLKTLSHCKKVKKIVLR